jgi:hypothetical protein
MKIPAIFKCQCWFEIDLIKANSEGRKDMIMRFAEMYRSYEQKRRAKLLHKEAIEQ